MHSYVSGRPKVLIVTNHSERLVAKRREGRERTKDTNESERTELWCKQLPRLGESGYHSDDEAAQEVDHQRPVWEGRERHLPVHQSAESVASESTKESPRTDNNRIDQGRFQVYLHVYAFIQLIEIRGLLLTHVFVPVAS